MCVALSLSLPKSKRVQKVSRAGESELSEQVRSQCRSLSLSGQWSLSTHQEHSRVPVLSSLSRLTLNFGILPLSEAGQSVSLGGKSGLREKRTISD